ncbi:transposase [Brevundimonas sp.]|uniref:transposase n=1 Tax=Brevundimonas sp. TaxID=1871086 RepID=UPI00391D7B04
MPRRLGRTNGCLNFRIRAVCDGQSRPLIMLLGQGQMSHFKGADLMIDALPRARIMLGDRGYDANRLRQALSDRGIPPRIRSRANRRGQIPHDAVLYRQRHKIEFMFGRLKDWRRIQTRYHRCAHTFMQGIVNTATVIFWLGPQ